MHLARASAVKHGVDKSLHTEGSLSVQRVLFQLLPFHGKHCFRPETEALLRYVISESFMRGMSD